MSPTEGRMWVAVRVMDDTSPATEYRGRMDAEVFRQITTNQFTAGWYALDSIVWERDRVDVSQREAGRTRGYGDTAYFRIEATTRIIPLAADYGRTSTGQTH